MDVKLNSKQFEAFDALTNHSNGVTEVLYGGGARGGKSFLGCLWQITNRIRYPGSVGFICRRSFARLIDTTLQTFFEVLDCLGLKEYGKFQTTANGNRSANTYYFPNGSMIFFRYIDRRSEDPNYDRFGSYSLTDMFVDEAQEIDVKAIHVLRGRFSLLTGRNADGTTWRTIPKSLFSCNPRKNWIYTDFVKPDRDGTIKPYRKFIKALPKDNPHVTQDFLDNLLRSDKVTVQRLYYGNFDYDDDPSVLCDYDAISDLFHNEHVQEVGGHSMSCDIAMKGHDRLVGGVWYGNVCKIVIDEAYSPGDVIVNKISQALIEHKVPRSLVVVDADGVGNFVSDFVKGIKEFHGGNRAQDPRYANIRAECLFKLADMINKRQIRIQCTEDQRARIMEELGVLKQAHIDNDTAKKDVIKKDEIKKLIQRSPDYLDMLMMAMTFRLTKTTNGAQVRVMVRNNE